MPLFEPTLHEGNGGVWYALPNRWGGTRLSSGGKVGQRCWTVYREMLCTNQVFDTWSEADDKASEMATDEVMAQADAIAKGLINYRNVYGHLPGRVQGYVEEGEVWS